jgi:hypothetical protein
MANSGKRWQSLAILIIHCKAMITFIYIYHFNRKKSKWLTGEKTEG